MAKATNRKHPSVNKSFAPFYLNSFIHLTILILLGYWSYSKVSTFDFTNWDEKRYIFETPLVQKLTWNNVKLMFTTKVLASYNPLVLLSLAFDYSIAGNNAGWYHLHNLLLHLLNGVLFYLCLKKLFNHSLIAFFCSGMFLIHPMHVEAVAWIASRKDVLYTFYFLLSFWMYLTYVKNNKSIYYIGSILLFLMSLLAKSQAVILPILFVLVQWYNQKLNKSSLIRLVPYFILSLIIGVVTLNGSNKGLTADEFGANFTFIQKIFLSAHAFSLYLFKSIIPINQSAIYAFNSTGANELEIVSYLSIGVVIAWSVLLIYLFKKNKSLFFGAAFFSVATFLVLHIIATNSSLIYERFTYVSYTGIFIMIAYLLNNRLKDVSFFYLSCIILFVFALVTKNRTMVWKNSETLWTDVINKQPTISIAYNNRGNVYYTNAQWDKALADFTKAIELNPLYPNSYSNKGSVNIYLGRYQEALKDNEKALSISPNFPEAWLGKGVALYNLNRLDEAITCYNKALKLLPNFPNAYNNRGGAYFKQKKYNEAIADFKTALRFAPNYEEARVNLALALIELQQYTEAENELLKVNNDPRKFTTLSDLYLKQGLLLYNQGKAIEAIQLYEKALSVYPQNAEAWYNMGGTYLMQHNIEKAKECWRKVLTINPNHSEASKWLKQIGG
jgi:tetratricopeptide (TPR) repeat protein